MRAKSLRYFYIAAVLLFFGNLLCSCIVFLQVHNSTNVYFVNPIRYLRRSNFDCYKKRTLNTANITSASFFSRKSIFFHSLWCDKMINEVGACAIESAARLHPQMSINLLFPCPVAKDTWSKDLDALIKLPNFRLIGIQVEDFASGTEFEKFWRTVIAYDKITDAKDVAEYLKLLTLQRFGGIVLDLNVILTKRLDTLGTNWVLVNDDWILNTDAMSIQLNKVGQNVTARALRSLSQQIIQQKNASTLFEDAFGELCPNHTLSDIDGNFGQKCHDFSFFNEGLFHPISRIDWKEYYLPGAYDKKAFAHRLWGDKQPEMSISRQSLYGHLAHAFCPWVFNTNIRNIE